LTFVTYEDEQGIEHPTWSNKLLPTTVLVDPSGSYHFRKANTPITSLASVRCQFAQWNIRFVVASGGNAATIIKSAIFESASPHSGKVFINVLLVPVEL